MEILPIVMPLTLPPGLAGPEPVEMDVRSFLVADGDRVVLVDTGMDPTGVHLDAGLAELGASWDDVGDVLITHHHPDHIGGLEHARARAPQARVWSGDQLPDSRAAGDGDRIGPLRVLSTPGHTPGHVSLVDERSGDVLVGDCVGTVAGRLQRAPAGFTADAEAAERSLRRLAEVGGAGCSAPTDPRSLIRGMRWRRCSAAETPRRPDAVLVAARSQSIPRRQDPTIVDQLDRLLRVRDTEARLTKRDDSDRVCRAVGNWRHRSLSTARAGRASVQPV